jgi:hypothetical protein
MPSPSAGRTEPRRVRSLPPGLVRVPGSARRVPAGPASRPGRGRVHPFLTPRTRPDPFDGGSVHRFASRVLEVDAFPGAGEPRPPLAQLRRCLRGAVRHGRPRRSGRTGAMAVLDLGPAALGAAPPLEGMDSPAGPPGERLHGRSGPERVRARVGPDQVGRGRRARTNDQESRFARSPATPAGRPRRGPAGDGGGVLEELLLGPGAVAHDARAQRDGRPGISHLSASPRARRRSPP